MRIHSRGSRSQWARRFRLAAALGAAMFVLAPASALATPPTLLTAGQQGGVPNASWSLPAGVVTSRIEVAASAQTEADGSFYFQNVRAWGMQLTTDQTSWTGDFPLQPGTYYTHVSGCPSTSSPCGPPQEEWSNIISFVVPQAPPPAGEPTPVEQPVQPLTMTASPRALVRARKLDATRFDVTTSAVPSSLVLRLKRGSQTVRVDLDLEDQGSGGDNAFRYTFTWFCGRSGRWDWTIKAQGEEGGTADAAGSFQVPACTRKGWFISANKVKQRLNRDFDFPSNATIVCRPTGGRRGALSDQWACGLRVPGQACSGEFRFRARIVMQGRDTISRSLNGSGGVECRT